MAGSCTIWFMYQWLRLFIYFRSASTEAVKYVEVGVVLACLTRLTVDSRELRIGDLPSALSGTGIPSLGGGLGWWHCVVVVESTSYTML